jgi:hypothetical protein
MNPFQYISERWFWRTLIALSLALLAYVIATKPGPRPAEPIGDVAPRAEGEPQ